jgi:hypothetical protein
MKYALVLILATSSCAYAQDTIRTNVLYQSGGAGVVTTTIGKGTITPVQGAPYSATVTNESVQTLADSTHIVQTNTGNTARDSQGRTRQDAPLPAIGNLAAANAPHLVFIMDPIAQTSYTLNLTDKTAQKISAPPGGIAGTGGSGTTRMSFIQMGSAVTASGPLPPPPQAGIVIQKNLAAEEDSQVSTEDLGSQTMEGLIVNGVRTTRTILAGQIGNDKAISIITEVWTSPDLKTVVYSKRSDPRIGEQKFELTNIVRAEPDPSLFIVPADYKVLDGPQNFIYRTNP